jgi:hypothetical protein
MPKQVIRLSLLLAVIAAVRVFFRAVLTSLSKSPDLGSVVDQYHSCMSLTNGEKSNLIQDLLSLILGLREAPTDRNH